jgi:hypothetical protein
VKIISDAIKVIKKDKMFKSSDKKHRKRGLMNLQCAPNKCSSSDDKDDDFYEVSNGHTQQKIDIQYTIDEAPSHLIRKTMKFEESHSQSGVDEVDNVGSTHVTRTVTSVTRNSKVFW